MEESPEVAETEATHRSRAMAEFLLLLINLTWPPWDIQYCYPEGQELFLGAAAAAETEAPAARAASRVAEEPGMAARGAEGAGADLALMETAETAEPGGLKDLRARAAASYISKQIS